MSADSSTTRRLPPLTDPRLYISAGAWLDDHGVLVDSEGHEYFKALNAPVSNVVFVDEAYKASHRVDHCVARLGFPAGYLISEDIKFRAVALVKAIRPECPEADVLAGWGRFLAGCSRICAD